MNYANRHDVPVSCKQKRVVFYASGIKIYGQIPYVLERKLKAEFKSNSVGFMGGMLTFPAGEPNFTFVKWRRTDGSPHKEAAVKDLLEWLYKDAGFQWAIATDFYDFFAGRFPQSWPPHTWVPAMEDERGVVAEDEFVAKIVRSFAIQGVTVREHPMPITTTENFDKLRSLFLEEHAI